MQVGTKSVLFGAHCFLIHPWFVMFAWWKLYGFPWDPRLWIAFFVHDLGYLGKPNMDGPEGETHVELGARIMHWFDWPETETKRVVFPTDLEVLDLRSKGFKLKSIAGYTMLFSRRKRGNRWTDFSRYHSRYYAKKDGVNPSRLCAADKLAVCLEPSWLYLPRVNWSGEIIEYMKMAGLRKYEGEPINKYESMNLDTRTQLDWFKAMTNYLRRWVEEHKDGREDTWTPEARKAVNKEGVYQ